MDTFQPDLALVAPLSHFRRIDVAQAGGKGANLGELWQAGFHVPPGFVITTAAYDLLFQENNLEAHLAGLLASLDLGHPDSARTVSHQIQNTLQEVSIPQPLAEQVLYAYRTLGQGAVAVRSSATAEDLPEAAFAGQQETFLNIVGEKELLEAVRACWSSLWSERAILYRARQHVDQATVKLAVVVQTMVPAEVAGVMFTANPVSGRRDELIVDANPGLGEAVVSGSVTPDHFIVDKHSLHLKVQQPGRREVIVRPKSGGGIEQVASAQERMKAVALPQPALRTLAQVGIRIERHYGNPQDIEWAWLPNGSRTGQFFVLQARPMTALPEPVNLSGPMRLVLPMLAEMWPTRPYPLDMTTFTGTIERAIGNLLVAMIGKSAPSPDEAFVQEDGVVVQFKPPQVHPSPSMLFTPWVTFWRTRHYDLSRWEADPLLAEFIGQAGALEQRHPETLSWKQNLETLQETLALIPRAMELRERYLPQAMLGLAGLGLLLTLTGHKDRFGALVSGVKTKTTETNQALEDVAERVRADKTLKELFALHEVQALPSVLQGSETGRAFLKVFDAFLDRYGHRESSLTISQPAWKDQPQDVLAILKVLAESQPRQPESYNAWRQARDELLAGSMLGSWFLRRPFLTSLDKTRYLFQIREDTHFYATMVQPILRHIALELGRRLVQAGALNNSEDVFHLTLYELKDLEEPWPPSEQTIAQIRSLVAQRKAKRESLEGRPMIDPRLLAGISEGQPNTDVLLQGTAGSPGLATGPVKIIHNPSEFGRLRQGDVLVAPVTNPAWTPLFQRAIAVIVDTGSSASHAAIVAREYGIPAVMGTIKGTQELEEGQWVKVDGSRGLVWNVESRNEIGEKQRTETT